MPRKEYEMTEEEFNELLDACKPVPYIIIGGHEPPSQQENANRFWKRLADKHGFVWDTAQPVNGKGSRFFSAEVGPKHINASAHNEGGGIDAEKR